MTNSEERARQEQRRRRLIERLNKKEEELLGRERMAQQRTQMSEEEQEAAIDRERHDWRNQFSPGGAGVCVANRVWPLFTHRLLEGELSEVRV